MNLNLPWRWEYSRKISRAIGRSNGGLWSGEKAASMVYWLWCVVVECGKGKEAESDICVCIIILWYPKLLKAALKNVLVHIIDPMTIRWPKQLLVRYTSHLYYKYDGSLLIYKVARSSIFYISIQYISKTRVVPVNHPFGR